MTAVTLKGWLYISPGWSECESQRTFEQPWVTSRVENRNPEGVVLQRRQTSKRYIANQAEYKKMTFKDEFREIW